MFTDNEGLHDKRFSQNEKTLMGFEDLDLKLFFYLDRNITN